MVYGRKRRRTTRRRLGRRRMYKRRRRTYRSGGRKTNFTMSKAIVPKTMKRTFNYVDRITLDPGTGGTSASHFFSCNSLYDPDRTGVGHQPLGFDQFVPTLYNHFVVIAAKLTCVFMSSQSTVSTAPVVASINIRDTTSATADITQAIEQGRCVYGVMNNASGGANTLSLSKTVNPNKFLGRSKPLSDPDLKGGGVNPAEECFFEVNIASAGTDDPDPVDVLVTLQYTAVLIEPARLTQS